MYRIHLMLFLMMCLHISGLMTNEPMHFGYWVSSSNEDSGVDFYTFMWKIKVSKKDCVEACKATDACEYINFEVRSHLCALVKAKDNRNGRQPLIEMKPGYIYMDKSEWNVDNVPSVSKDNADSQVPGGNHMVKENTSSGCSVPKVEDFKGNMLSSGAKILLSCRLSTSSFLEDFEFVRSTCAENGTWTHPFKCQPYFKGSYYYMQQTVMTWHDAKINCESMSGHLYDINSAEEEAFVKSAVVVAEYDTMIWIGGNDLEKEGTFQWSDGSLVSTSAYQNWGESNPDNHLNDEHCMEIYSTTYQWNDGICYKYQPSICEFP